ncbi:MAG TPA: 2-amino-4-hydroxy-6-hydroxymethyldihydropteridine diphosphokinase [Gammaproteobacteria bacterium]
MTVRAYIGLGSNLDDPLSQVKSALAELAYLPRSRLHAASPLYRTPPLGPAGQPDYINAVAALDTELAPLALLDELQRIEQHHGRVRGPLRWGPRTLDLDLLLYGDAVISSERLTVPHPGLRERPFVIFPLRAIAPALILADGTSLASLAEKFATQEPPRVDE